jgi:hypothetical protein
MPSVEIAIAANLARSPRRQDRGAGADYGAAMSAAVATRTYTPLALREPAERWLVAALAAIVAVVWCLVLPLELVLGA